MNQSGVGVHSDVAAAFNRNDSRALLLSIQDGLFRLIETFSEPDDSKLFGLLRSSINDTEPCTILLKDEGKWVVLAWTPDASSVNLRMLYASSRAGLKVSLGSTYFLPDWQISSTNEFQLSSFKNHLKNNSLACVMTLDEKEAEAAYRDSQPSAVKQNAMQKMEMSKSPELLSALSNYKSKQIKYIVIALSQNQESFIVESSGADFDVDALSKSLPENDPRFVLLMSNDEDNVLVHYCPEGSDRVHKMAYSALKRNLMDTLENQSISVSRSIQAFEKAEITKSTLSTKNPERVSSFESPKHFAKPSRPGRGAARLN